MELIVLYREAEHRVRLDQDHDGKYQVEVGGKSYEVDVATAGAILSLGVDDGRQLEVAVRRLRGQGAGAVYQVSSSRGLDTVEIMDPLEYLLQQSKGETHGASKVEALMPGRVVELLVAEGDEVAKGQGVVVVEAMKMKNEIQAEASGTLVEIFVSEGQNVEAGDPLFEVGSGS